MLTNTHSHDCRSMSTNSRDVKNHVLDTQLATLSRIYCQYYYYYCWTCSHAQRERVDSLFPSLTDSTVAVADNRGSPARFDACTSVAERSWTNCKYDEERARLVLCAFGDSPSLKPSTASSFSWGDHIVGGQRPIRIQRRQIQNWKFSFGSRIWCYNYYMNTFTIDYYRSTQLDNEPERSKNVTWEMELIASCHGYHDMLLVQQWIKQPIKRSGWCYLYTYCACTHSSNWRRWLQLVAFWGVEREDEYICT